MSAENNKDTESSSKAEPEKLVLQNAEVGKVKTRFPPEASGFLHIGHAKAALVNSMLRDKYKGQMVFRYDDTNPEKEKQDFEDAIKEDLKSLGVTWEKDPTHSSDYFDQMLGFADKLVAEGNAYCDQTEQQEMRRCRMEGEATKFRDTPVEENQRLWAEMKAGSEEGRITCLRAKMSVDAANKALRDPVIYRVNVETPHVKTRTKYKTYPTYDFCCPIVDSLEGVTHALRTSEYRDRNDQYAWFLEKLALVHKPQLDDFSRLNMEYTLMSKRKLTLLVEEGVVDGWDDPRFPTVRGLLRRGLTVEALRAFVNVQGMSKVGNLMEWSKLWAFNNNVIDPVAPRYTVVSYDTAVRATITGEGAPVELTPFEKALHKKNSDLGVRTAYTAPVIYVDAADVALLTDQQEVTLMDWGNANVVDIVYHFGNKRRPVACKFSLNGSTNVKKTYKMTWVPENPGANFHVTLVEYDHLLTKKKPEADDELKDILAKKTKYTQEAIGEPAMKALKHGDKLQLERRGFYIVDAIDVEKRTATLIAIPSPIEKANHLSAKSAYWAEEEAAQAASVGADTTSTACVDAAKQATKPAGGQPVDAMTLEERRAAKKAAKTASSKKKDEKAEE